MSDNSHPQPPPRGVQEQRYGLFTQTGAGVAAGSGAGLVRRTFLSLVRGPDRPYLLLDMSAPALGADWLRLLAEQLVGDPSRATLSGYTQPGGAEVVGGTLTWDADPTPDVDSALVALAGRDIPTLLRLTAGA